MQIYWIYTVNIWYIIKLRPDDLRGLNGRFTRLAHQIRLQPYNILKISSLMFHFHENVFVSCFPKWKLRVEEQPIHIHCVPLDIPASKRMSCGIICHEHGSRPGMAVNTKTIHHIWHYETIPVNQWHDRQFPPTGGSPWFSVAHRATPGAKYWKSEGGEAWIQWNSRVTSRKVLLAQLVYTKPCLETVIQYQQCRSRFVVIN